MSSGWMMCVRPVADYPGYFVDRTGGVWSQRRQGGAGLTNTLHKLKPAGRYPKISITRNSRKKNLEVHRLVCEAFHGPAPAGMEVAHGDGNPHNSRSENLRWATKKENSADRYRHGTHCAGMRNPNRKLSTADVLAIRYLDNRSSTLIAEEYGVSRQTIWSVRKGETW